MRIQNSKNSNRSSQKAGRASLSGIKRSGKNGSSKAGSDDLPFGRIGFHLLEKELRNKPLFELSMLSGDGVNAGLIKMIDSEAKQLQAIHDLYQVLRAHPKYKNLKEPNWNIDTAPFVVLYWILRKLGPLAGGNNWTVDTYLEGKKTRYRFVIYKYYHRQYLKDQKEYIPLDFLPALKKRDLPLHDMIIDIVALVSKENKIPLWDEDGDFSTVLKDFVRNRSDHNSVAWNQYNSYTLGPAAEYLNIIKERRKVITPMTLERSISLYDAKSHRKRVLVWWIKKGYHLAAQKQDISINTFVPNYVTGSPITPYRMYKFIWSLHDNDILKLRTFSKLKKDDKYGSFLPVEFSIVEPGKQLQPIRSDNFPLMLFEFMSVGSEMICYRFREYFYKKQFNSPKTPSEQLLEQIENIEIKNLNK